MPTAQVRGISIHYGASDFAIQGDEVEEATTTGASCVPPSRAAWRQRAKPTSTAASAPQTAATPAYRERLMSTDPKRFIQVLARLRELLFVSGAHLPVMRVADSA
jgi:hypothetical protein